MEIFDGNFLKKFFFHRRNFFCRMRNQIIPFFIIISEPGLASTVPESKLNYFLDADDSSGDASNEITFRCC